MNNNDYFHFLFTDLMKKSNILIEIIDAKQWADFEDHTQPLVSVMYFSISSQINLWSKKYISK